MKGGRTCHFCTKKLTREEKFCSYCGVKTSNLEEETKTGNKTREDNEKLINQFMRSRF